MKKIFLLCLLISKSSFAWFPPPNYFFQQWVTENKGIIGIVIKFDRETMKDNVAIDMSSETIKIKRPGLYKWLSSTTADQLKLLGKTKAMMGTSQSLRQVQLLDVITPLDVSIIYNQVGTIESVMKQIGVDVAKSSLELNNHLPRICIGEKGGNHLYVSSTTGVIESMVFKNLTYQFTYDPKAAFQNYPSEIEIYDGEVLKEKIHIKSISTSAKISDQEFES